MHECGLMRTPHTLPQYLGKWSVQKIELCSEASRYVAGADAIAIRTKRPLYFDLGDLVGLGDLAGVAAGGTLSFSSTIMTTDVKGLAHFD